MGAFIALFVIIIGIVGFVAGLIAVSSIINGWILTKLWHWFAVPIFGLHELTLTQAIGVAMIIAFLTNRHVKFTKSTKNKDSDTDWGVLLSAVFVAPLVTLLFGWIVHLFM